MAPVEATYFAAEVDEAIGGAVKAIGGADDGDVVPHEAADFVPVVVDDDLFVWGSGVAVFPLRNVGGVGRGGIEGVQGEEFFEGSACEDVAFEQGVGGETVGSVESGAGDFADGKQAADVGASVGVGDDAAALVVGGGDDGNGGCFTVVSEFEQGGVDVRKAFSHEALGFVGDVEVDAVGPGFFNLVVDGACYDVAGCEGFTVIVFLHEFVALFIAENTSLAADGLGNEEGACLGASGGGVEEAGGVELDEFHVGDGGAGAPCHGDAVSGGAIWVGGIEVDFAAATCGENDAV